jgi:hypothetical protein
VSATSHSASTLSPLVGSWRLVSFELRDEGGNVTHPWGDAVSGMLTYTADGFLSEQFGSAHRPMLTHDDWVSASATEIDLAARQYFAYAGTYEIEDESVIYRIEVSLMPNWVGKTERRNWSISGDTLTTTTPPLLVGGKMQVSTLVWQRAQYGRS